MAPQGQGGAGGDGALIAVIADEDTVTGFLLAGVGNMDLRRRTNFLVVDSKTPMKQVEDTFKEFCAREDVGIVLISQYIAENIRHTVNAHTQPIPAVLEIPSKDHPYNPANDGVLARVQHLMGEATAEQ